MIKRFLFCAALLLSAASAAADWQQTLQQARGQTIYFNAWGGSERINAYIRWAGEQVSERYGVQVEHVKVTDTADVVTRVLAEKTAGRDQQGSVDLVWINGENFAAMKRQQLLFGPWSTELPNYQLVDAAGKPSVSVDFTVPVDGLEAPWGMAQIVFIYDTAELSDPPRSMPALLAWAASDPGRFSYPLPPDFLGSSFLKQALIELSANASALAEPATDANFDKITAPLWDFLDQLHPHLWRGGRAFPASGEAQKLLLADGEVDLWFSFSPSDASSAIVNGELPDTVRSYVLDGGTLGNTHFVAIPYNASAPQGAQVFANFLLSAEAQARKQDPRYWGDPTVLDVAALDDNSRALFEQIDLGIATLSPEQLGRSLPEPHASWMERIEQTWTARYGSGR